METNMHSNFKTVLNKDCALPHYDIEKYKLRHKEHVNYHKKYTGYKGVVWTPLDIPKLELDLDRLWEVWQAVAEGRTIGTASPWFDKKPEDLNSARHTKYDKTLDKVNDHDYRNLIVCKAEGSYHSADIAGEWEEFMYDEMPQVVEWLEAMPWDNIRWVGFVGRDAHGVGPHYDEYRPLRHLLEPQEPSQVRVRWSHLDWRNEHLYFTKDHAETRLYPQLPPDTNSMAYDGTVHEHGADAGYHPTERIQLMPMGTLNIQKWHELLDRSIEKYKDYVITEDFFK
jgi:hypothetical protein